MRLGAVHGKRPTADLLADREAEGRSIRAWREGAGRARRDVAADLGVNPKTLLRWEDGSMAITDERREQLRALGWQRAEAA